MKVDMGADHGGFEMKQQLTKLLANEVVDFGNKVYDNNDDYPGFAIPLARSVAREDVERCLLVCGSGIGIGWVKSLNATKAGPPLWRNGNRCCHRTGVIGGNDDAV